MSKLSKNNNKNYMYHNISLKSKIIVCLCIMLVSCTCYINTVYADWFNVDSIKPNLINPMYQLVNNNLGIVAFVVGGLATFIARGADMYQKAIAFGVGSLGTAGSVVLAKSVLDLGA